MKKLTYSLIIVLLISSFGFAQGEAKTSIAAGSKALLFEFSGFSNLGANNYEGGIGGKYFLSNELAVRANLQFAHASVTIPANPGPGQVGIDGEISGTEFGVGAALEYHFLKSSRVSPYIGGGVGITVASTDNKSVERGTAGTTLSQMEVKNQIGGEPQIGMTAGTGFTVGGIIGVEFFLFKELSLGAEYRVGLLTMSQADEEASVNSITVTTKGGSMTSFGITNQGFITLAVYF